MRGKVKVIEIFIVLKNSNYFTFLHPDTYLMYLVCTFEYFQMQRSDNHPIAWSRCQEKYDWAPDLSDLK